MYAPVGVRLLSDQLSPVLAYRRLVAPDRRLEPSFLFESVEGGERQGRYSILGAHPVFEIIARGGMVTLRFRAGMGAGLRGAVHSAAGIRDDGGAERTIAIADPLALMKRMSGGLAIADVGEASKGALPKCVLGGWFGFAAYDSVRYAEPGKLPESRAPKDDRGLPELHFSFYDGVVVFDHVAKLVHVVKLVELPTGGDARMARRAFDEATSALQSTVGMLETHSKPLPAGLYAGSGGTGDAGAWRSNMTREQHRAMVERAKEYIRAGDIFQVVLGQRFERASACDPFDVYRALRVVNPSPYMVYLQAEGCILIASSPEILCRVRREGGALIVTNRPLAGTRKRGVTEAEDRALERELLADHKERAEHIMLVDLGRNDVGVVARAGSVKLPALMEIERYSHVMHISSTVTGELRDGLDCWDALRAALPVGTISGAPKVRAMQIIDELEPVRRGPYGGGLGYASLGGEMDIALALRTMVVPTARLAGGTWVYHLQAAGGIVYDSSPEAEYQETVNKAAAMMRAIEVAEIAFLA